MDRGRPVVHGEIQARDPENMRVFSTRMFNREIGDGRVMNIPAGIAGPEHGPAGYLKRSDKPGVVRYVQVPQLAEPLERAAEFGGTTLCGARDAPPAHDRQHRRPEGQPRRAGSTVASD